MIAYDIVQVCFSSFFIHRRAAEDAKKFILKNKKLFIFAS